MRRAEQIKRAKAYNRFIRINERLAFKRIYAELNRPIRQITKRLPQEKQELNYEAIILSSLPKLEVAMTGVINTVAGKYVRNVLPSHFEMDLPIKNENNITNAQDFKLSVLQIMALFAGRQAQVAVNQITQTTLKVIRKIVSDGFSQGLPYAEIAEKIGERLKFNQSRAMIIARNTVSDAALRATDVAKDELIDRLGRLDSLSRPPQVMKRWVAAVDERTRPTHSAMNSKPYIPESQKFDVGGFSADRPRDPNLPAKEVINCRCNVLYKVIA